MSSTDGRAYNAADLARSFPVTSPGEISALIDSLTAEESKLLDEAANAHIVNMGEDNNQVHKVHVTPNKLRARYWAIFSKLMSLTHLTQRQLHIVDETIAYIVNLRAEWLHDEADGELIGLYGYIKARQSYNGFAYLGLTQKNMNINFPIGDQEDRRGIIDKLTGKKKSEGDDQQRNQQRY